MDCERPRSVRGRRFSPDPDKNGPPGTVTAYAQLSLPVAGSEAGQSWGAVDEAALLARAREHRAQHVWWRR